MSSIFNEDKWISELSIGELVFISQHYGQVPSQGIVSRKTATMIIVSSKISGGQQYKSRFRTETGRSIGGSTWDGHHLIKDSPEIRKQVYVSRLKYKATKMRNNLGTPNDQEKLEQLIKALEPFMPEVLK